MADYIDTDDTSTIQMKPKKEKELTVVQDTGFFKHSTGDTYDGFFEAKKKDKSVRMHGPGTYTTNEGETYTGIWESDKLGFGGDDVCISYRSKAIYEGRLKDWNYNGKGRYVYPDNSFLNCEFENNCPVGNITMTDPNGHQWLSKADVGFAWFQPENHYYNILESVIDKAEIKKRRKECNRIKQPMFFSPNKLGKEQVKSLSEVDQKKKAVRIVKSKTNV